MSCYEEHEEALRLNGANNTTVNNVPNEIWDHTLGFVEPVEERARTSYNLSRTCRAIYHQTLVLPSVGKAIHILSTGQHDAVGEKHIIGYAKYLLNKAGESSLSWKLREHSGDPKTHPQEFKAMDELLGLFFDSHEQWYAIDLSICASHQGLNDKFKQISKPLHQLRSARINIFESSGAIFDEDEVWRALMCPTIAKVGTTFGCGLSYFPANIPYRQLTCLVLDGSYMDIEIAQLATLLDKSCPNIQDLGLNPIVYSQVSYNTVNLPKLQRLFICEGDQHAVRKLLEILGAPKLFDLRIKYYYAFNAHSEFQALDSLADRCAVKDVFLDACHKPVIDNLKGEVTNIRLCTVNSVIDDIDMLLSLNS